ncbi:MAG: hypothetical protein IJB91_05400 [Oscillospiraceae bacterium]|nr:hypothetical protein [Oscillospiraceae bacterium]
MEKNIQLLTSSVTPFGVPPSPKGKAYLPDKREIDVLDILVNQKHTRKREGFHERKTDTFALAADFWITAGLCRYIGGTRLVCSAEHGCPCHPRRCCGYAMQQNLGGHLG